MSDEGQSCKSGIYKIENKTNGKCYVGSAVNINNRWREHKRNLKNNAHNRKLQNAWNKHGPEAFEFSVIEYVSDTRLLISVEQRWIDTLEAASMGYNISPNAGSTLGVVHTKATRDKYSLAKIRDNKILEDKGLPHFNKGIIRPQEHRDAISRGHAGIPLTVQHRESIKAALLDYNLARKKEGISHHSKGSVHSDQTRKSMSAAHTGKIKSESHRRALSLSLRGKKQTPEQAAKNKESQIKAAARRVFEGAPHPNAGRKLSAEAVTKRTATRAANKAKKIAAAAEEGTKCAN